MKNNSILCIILCLIMVLSFPATALANEIQNEEDSSTSARFSNQIASGCSTLDAQMPLMGTQKLLDTSGAAILYEVNTQTMMYAWNADLPLEPASLVKIMTAIIALENGDPSAKITVTDDALRPLSGSSTTNLKTGENICLDDLLNCLLVGSSNDAAVVIADHIGGSQRGFVALMNQKAEQLGMKATLFTNPHGLPEEGQTTTARDMGRLLAYASQVDTFKPYFARTAYTVPATNLSEERILSSTNYMMMQDKKLYYDARVTGGRTGITADRNRCLAVTAEADSLLYVGVILDAVPDFQEDGYTVKRFGSYEEMRQLLSMGFDDYALTQVLMQGQALTQCTVVNGANSVLAMPSQTVTAILPSGIDFDQLTVLYEQNINELSAPVQSGEALTNIQIWYHNICVAQASVVAGNSSPVKTSVVIPRSAETVGVWMVILMIIGTFVLICGIFFIVLLGIRYGRRFAARTHRRRRMSERRRSK